jgi:hypothetical protein
LPVGKGLALFCAVGSDVAGAVALACAVSDGLDALGLAVGAGLGFESAVLDVASHVGSAYLITSQQFSDVAAQEMYREPGADLDLAEVIAAGSVQVGPGRYETLVHVGQNEQAPMLTFTAPWGIDDVQLLSPSDKYLRMLGRGLCDAHGWDSEKAATYLAGLPGARGTWTPEQITPLIASS